ANDRRMWDLFRALSRGWNVEQLNELTKIDPWFLRQFAEIAELRRSAATDGPVGNDKLAALDTEAMRVLKRAGFGDAEIGLATGSSEAAVRERRTAQGPAAVFKAGQTCAAP